MQSDNKGPYNRPFFIPVAPWFIYSVRPASGLVLPTKCIRGNVTTSIKITRPIKSQTLKIARDCNKLQPSSTVTGAVKPKPPIGDVYNIHDSSYHANVSVDDLVEPANTSMHSDQNQGQQEDYIDEVFIREKDHFLNIAFNSQRFMFSG